MKILGIVLFISFPLLIYSQKHCDCKSDDVKEWNEKGHGVNEKITKSEIHFQQKLT